MASKKKLAKKIAALEKSFTSPGLSASPLTARMFGPLLQSNAGIPVTPYTALGSTTVVACVRALSEDTARLPLNIQTYNRRSWQVSRSHRLALLMRRPNRWHNEFDFKSFLVASYAMRGNAYSAIIRDNEGFPISLVPISPDRVQINISENGNLYYQIKHPLIDQGEDVLIPSFDMIHIRGITLDGYTGISPIQVGQETIGLALAAQTHGAKTFANGAGLQGVLEAPTKLSNEAAKRMADSWREIYSGTQNAGRTAVLEEGVKFNNISMTLEDAQFLATRQFQVIDICRLFRVPPHKVMELSDSHYANIENMNQQYIDDALAPICIRFEEEFNEKLLMADELNSTRFAFNFDAMLKADQATRFNTYQTATTSGVLSINECRERENLPPVDGGDEHRSQMQNVPITDPTPAEQGMMNGNDQQPAIPDASSKGSPGSKRRRVSDKVSDS
jgi:HK97 family phage portal protein